MEEIDTNRAKVKLQEQTVETLFLDPAEGRTVKCK